MLEPRQIPIDLQTIASLLRRPESIRNHRYGAPLRERDLEHVAHSIETTRVTIVDTLHTSAKNRWVRNEGDFHPRQVEIEAKLLRAVTLRVAVETRHSLADKAKLRRVLELHVLRNRLLPGVVRKLSIASRAIAWSVHDAVLSATLIRIDFPTIRSLSDEHRTDLCAKLAILLKRVRDR